MDRKDNTNYSSSSDAPPAYSEDPDDLPKDDQKEVEQSLKWIPKAPSGRANYTPLARPVAIPQVGVGKRMGPPMPFVRGYSPELAAHDVNKEDFAAFIDNLAIAIAAPAPFQVLQMGSMVAGFVPNGIAQLVSMGVGVAAGAGQAAFIIARSKKYFARVNAEFFHPRGLEVHMKKDPEFCQILGLQGQSLQQVNAATVDNVVSDTTPLPERRLRVLQPYVAHLTLDVPPPAQQKNIIDRMTAKTQQISVARQQRKNQKNAEKQMEKAQKEARKDEKHHRRHSPTNTFQSSQQGYYESSQSYREADSYSDDSSIASIEHEIMHLNMKAAQLHVPAGHKSEIKLEKLAEEKAKLLGKLDKKKRKHQSKRIPGRMEGPYDYGAQPGDGGQTEGLMKHSEDGMQPGNVPHADHKQQEKETSQLESLRWLVVQNLQNH